MHKRATTYRFSYTSDKMGTELHRYIEYVISKKKMSLRVRHGL